MLIDIAMTATLRAEVLSKTLESIRTKLINPDGFRLVVNIDPVGIQGTLPDVLNIINENFPNNIINTPKTSDHVKAFRWVWENSKSEYILFWEDDYVLLKNIELQSIINSIKDISKLAYVNFDRKNKSVLSYAGYKGRFKQYSEYLWERIMGNSLGGPPSLMTSQYIKSMLPLIVGEPDLLSTYHPKAQKALTRWKFFTYTEHGGSHVEDIGRAWLSSKGLVRTKHEFGLEWS
jgi:hypothetical protein